jgi:hypothetical protein
LRTGTVESQSDKVLINEPTIVPTNMNAETSYQIQSEPEPQLFFAVLTKLQSRLLIRQGRAVGPT